MSYHRLDSLGALSPSALRMLAQARGGGGGSVPSTISTPGGPAFAPMPDAGRGVPLGPGPITLYPLSPGGAPVTADPRPAPDAGIDTSAPSPDAPPEMPEPVSTRTWWDEHWQHVALAGGAVAAGLLAFGAYKAGKRKPNRRARRHNLARLKWEQKAPAIWVAIAPVTFEDFLGRKQTRKVALRVDGREGPYRVDMTTGLGPFEAIDGGRGFTSMRDAKGRAAAWLAAANALQTLQPVVATQRHANRRSRR